MPLAVVCTIKPTMLPTTSTPVVTAGNVQDPQYLLAGLNTRATFIHIGPLLHTIGVARLLPAGLMLILT